MEFYHGRVLTLDLASIWASRAWEQLARSAVLQSKWNAI